MKKSLSLIKKALALTVCAATLVLAASPASAQYYYPNPGYYPPPPPVYYPQPQPYYVPQQVPGGYYTPAPVRRGGVAEQCSTQYGTCQIGPTRPGRGCNCFFPGSGKIPGVAVR